eukprot:7445043-Alexandrium_andersonii.AAC.1
MPPPDDSFSAHAVAEPPDESAGPSGGPDSRQLWRSRSMGSARSASTGIKGIHALAEHARTRPEREQQAGKQQAVLADRAALMRP